MNQEKSMQHLKIEVKVDGKVVCEYKTTISTPKNAFAEFWALGQLFRDDGPLIHTQHLDSDGE